jgi:methylation protein EvaC
MIDTFLDFGLMPIANGFIPASEIPNERRFPLSVGYDPETGLVQLVDPVAAKPEILFNSSYPFRTGSSSRMVDHFETTARELSSGVKTAIELGSNDGTFLKALQQCGVQGLGFEPCQHLADEARAKGVVVRSEFFSKDSVSGDSKVDLVYAANVLCHIADLHSVFEGVRKVLSPDGRFVFEDPCLFDILSRVSYDQIYDEHVWYFYPGAVAALARRHGLKLEKTETLWTHGGSARYTLRRGADPRTPAFVNRIELATFRTAVEKSLERLIKALRDAKKLGPVVGYGATSKSTTVLNYCGLGPSDLDYIADSTREKQGKVTPGSHIPIVSLEDFRRDNPKTAILFAWNHEREVRDNERVFLSRGGKFLKYVQ